MERTPSDPSPIACGPTTDAVQRYLSALGGDEPVEPIIQALLTRAVNRLNLLGSSLLHRSYPRLLRPPLNLRAEELLSSVVERLLKAMKTVRPGNVRQFFALATKHMRWELNDLARRLDERPGDVELTENAARAPEESDSPPSPDLLRILSAIDALPEAERETFELVRIQGLTHAEVGEVMGVSTKTVQRRLNKGLLLLEAALADLKPGSPDPDDSGA